MPENVTEVCSRTSLPPAGSSSIVDLLQPQHVSGGLNIKHQTNLTLTAVCLLACDPEYPRPSPKSIPLFSLRFMLQITDYKSKKQFHFTSKFCLSSNCRDEQEYSEHTSSEVLCGGRVCIVIYDRYISPRVFLGVHSADAGREKDYENSLEM